MSFYEHFKKNPLGSGAKPNKSEPFTHPSKYAWYVFLRFAFKIYNPHADFCVSTLLIFKLYLCGIPCTHAATVKSTKHRNMIFPEDVGTKMLLLDLIFTLHVRVFMSLGLPRSIWVSAFVFFFLSFVTPAG